MAKVKLDFGAELDVLTQGELEQTLGRAASMWYARYRGVTIRRLPTIQGTPAGGAVAFGGSAGKCGPGQGYAWSVRELNVVGLTAGATPDVVNIYRGESGLPQQLFWQLNGNQFLQTFGRGEKIMFAGEELYVVSVGTFAATGQITLSGLALEVVGERMPELAV